MMELHKKYYVIIIPSHVLTTSKDKIMNFFCIFVLLIDVHQTISSLESSDWYARCCVTQFAFREDSQLRAMELYGNLIQQFRDEALYLLQTTVQLLSLLESSSIQLSYKIYHIIGRKKLPDSR